MTPEPATVLIANRGEIGLRILRACRSLGLRVVAVHSEADAGMPWLAQTDASLCIGPGSAAKSYLDIGAILMAAEVLGADAVHPGYGFLSENADFADAVEAAGLTFIGPTGAIIRRMGDKIAAKAAMRAAGVPCVPGSDGALPEDPQSCARIAGATGYPLIVKAAGGGGGRGMRLVETPEALAEAIRMTREEARSAFGNPTLYLERYLASPRHIEVQVLCDGHGGAVSLGARDCSIQRRHQKLLEEAPPPGIAKERLDELGRQCVEACLSIGYRGAGTFEFLYEDGVFAFIEMNTRIQVEHPVTELVTGIDIVAEQIAVALGRPLSIGQEQVRESGHAVECRINAEDVATGLPSAGVMTGWSVPQAEGLRIDSHIAPGVAVPPFYDSMIAKVIAHGATRQEAIERLDRALCAMRAEGVATNIGMQRRILSDPGLLAGGVSIHHFERHIAGAPAG